MHFNKIGRANIRVSEVGLGCEHLQGKDYGVIQDTINRALYHGMNILDIFMSEPQVRTDIGRAIKPKRADVVIQAHIGSTWSDNQYVRSRDLKQCRLFFEDYLEKLQTDYLDIGMLHFCDTLEDLDKIIDRGILDYALRLKREGKIRAVGLSSHDPLTARTAVETGKIDVLMFSLNPAFDILPASITIEDLFHEASTQTSKRIGIHPAREALYQACSAMGTSITVMKGYAGGMLLNHERSPFGSALTPVQCIHYGLSRPAVASVLVGCQTPDEVDAAAAYTAASYEEKDFSEILSKSHAFSMRGKCMYCYHCLPCPSEINIAQTIKYLDLGMSVGRNSSQSATIREHYHALKNHASDCIFCGQCESRCPFEVPIMEKMNQASHFFNI